MTIERIVLAGFSGTGKSTVARELALLLNWTTLDVDKAIEIVATRSIPEIFADQGEAAFRVMEREALLRALDQSKVVIATGGGAVVADDAWSADVLRRPGTLVVTLDGSPEQLIERLRRQVALAGETIERPMLAGDDPLGRMMGLKQSRQPAYDRADITLPTDECSASDIARTIAGFVSPTNEPVVSLEVGGSRSDIHVRAGIRNEVGSRIASRWPKARAVWIVTDSNIGPLHAAPLAQSIESAGPTARTITVPPGESSKCWSVAGDVIGSMLDGGIQRNDVVVALGGGVVGDLAGFAASVVLRGVGLVQMPTSLLAMVDSSVGGKTGVNHSTGKNLIGSFYQPHLVLIDPELLRTLPPRELNQGWAEVVKHAFIQPSTPDSLRHDLAGLLERSVDSLLALREPATSYLITRNVQIKASVVRADERESSLRAILNFGHTIGHAIEAAEYRYLHGEAVAVGMRAAIRIAELQRMIDEPRAREMVDLILRFGLPVTAQFDPELVLERMKSDKKSVAGQQTWVLPVQSGGVELVAGIDQETLRAALESVRA